NDVRARKERGYFPHGRSCSPSFSRNSAGLHVWSIGSRHCHYAGSSAPDHAMCGSLGRGHGGEGDSRPSDGIFPGESGRAPTSEPVEEPEE
ncbi:unnamed protein product, partial [Polarella glacialis]